MDGGDGRGLVEGGVVVLAGGGARLVLVPGPQPPARQRHGGRARGGERGEDEAEQQQRGASGRLLVRGVVPVVIAGEHRVGAVAVPPDNSDIVLDK